VFQTNFCQNQADCVPVRFFKNLDQGTTQLKLECRLDTYNGIETVSGQVSFQHLILPVYV
jgi:hypothetical protein